MGLEYLPFVLYGFAFSRLTLSVEGNRRTIRALDVPAVVVVAALATLGVVLADRAKVPWVVVASLLVAINCRLVLEVEPNETSLTRRVLTVRWWRTHLNGSATLALDGWGDELDPEEFIFSCADRRVTLGWVLSQQDADRARRLLATWND